MKEAAFLLAILLLTGLTSASSHNFQNSSIENISIETGFNDSQVNVTVSDEQFEEIEHISLYESLRIEMDERINVVIRMSENETWAKNWMRNNPEAFEGPGQQYNPYFMSAYKGDSLFSIPLAYQNGAYVLEVDRPGKYYIGFEGIVANSSFYLNQEGACGIHYNGSGIENLNQVEQCPDNDSGIFSGSVSMLKYILVLLLPLLVIYLKRKDISSYLREKILVHKLERLTEKSKNLENGGNDILLNKLIEANEELNQNNFDEASRLISEVQKSLSNE